LLIACFLLVPRLVAAQTTITPGTSHVGFDTPGQSAAVANSFTYNVYVDALPKVTLANVTCSAGTPNTTCVADWPSMAAGVHTLTITQASGTAESGKSTGLSITMVVLVVPTNPRQVP